MMRGLESWVSVGTDKVPTKMWMFEARDVTQPRSDGSKYIGDYYAQLTVNCALLKPGICYTFYLREINGPTWKVDGTVQTSGLIDCREAPVQYVNGSAA